jgi:hypothetical protein
MARKYPQLAALAGFPFPVYSSESACDRAESIAARAERAHRFLAETLNADARIEVVVLAPDHWSTYATFPVYGMPHILDKYTLVVAGQGSDFWHSMTPPLANMPPHIAQIARSRYGGTGTVDYSPFFDLLAVHEMGHLFHYQAGIQFPRLWLMELFCNLCLQCYVAEAEPDQRLSLETFPQIVVDLGEAHLQHTALADLERLYAGVGAANYGWYQSQWLVAVRQLYEDAGVPVLQRLWRAFLGSPEFPSDAALSVYLRETVHPELARVQDEWPPYGRLR